MVEKGTSRVVDVPDAQAQAAFQSGKYGIPKGGALPVKVGSDVGQVAAEDAQAAFRAGYRTASEAEYRQAAREHAYGGAGGMAAAAGAGLVRGAGEALGLPSDYIATTLADQVQGGTERGYDPWAGNTSTTFGQRVRGDLGALQAENPMVSGAAEMVGLAAGTALAPGGGAMGLARTAGEGAALRLGARAGGFLAAGAAAAAEGGVLGGVSAANEAALGNEELTAERVLAGIGHGAVLGGVAGAALHVPGTALSAIRSRLSPQAVEAVAEKTFGYAAPGLGSAVEEMYYKAASAASGKQAEHIAMGLARTEEGAATRRLLYEGPRLQDEAALALRTEGDTLLKASRAVSEEAMGELKGGYVRRAVKRGNEGETANYALRTVTDAVEAANGLLESGLTGKSKKSVKNLRTLAEQTGKEIWEAVERGGPDVNADVFMSLDRLKRAAQGFTKNARPEMVADPLERAQATKAKDWFFQTQEGMRKSLESEEMWGKAGADQERINRIWSQQIESGKRFHESLTTQVGRDPADPFRQLRGIDPSKADTFLRNVTNPTKDLTTTAVRDYVRNTRELAEAIAESYGEALPAAKVAEVKTLQQAAERFGRTVETSAERQTKYNQLRELMGSDAGEGGGLVNAALGGLLGGAPGAVLGGVGSAVMNPGKVVAQMAAIERLAAKADNAITRGIRTFMSGSAPAAAESASTKMLRGAAGERSAFEASVKHVQEMVANPDKLAERIAQTMGEDMGSAAPNVSAAFSAAVVRGAQFLADKAPVGMSPPPDVLTPQFEKPIYSDAEMRQWTRYAAAVNDPSTILESMARGRVSPEEVEVMREVYPQLYAATQTRIMSSVAGLKVQMLRPQRLQLSILFGVPADSNMTQSMLAALQQAAPPAQEAPRGGKLNPGTRTLTLTSSASQQIGKP